MSRAKGGAGEDLDGLLRGLKLTEQEKKGVRGAWRSEVMEPTKSPQAVGKLFASKTGYADGLVQTVGRIWCPQKGIRCKELGNNRFLFSFLQPGESYPPSSVTIIARLFGHSLEMCPRPKHLKHWMALLLDVEPTEDVDDAMGFFALDEGAVLALEEEGALVVKESLDEDVPLPKLNRALGAFDGVRKLKDGGFVALASSSSCFSAFCA